MIGTKKSGIALAMGLLLATPVAFGQAQTKESAHAFLASVINKGSTWDDDYDSFVNYVGSDCSSQLALKKNGNRYNTGTMHINWSNVSAVEKREVNYSDGVVVKGAIAFNGEVKQKAWFKPDSTAMRDRFAVAFEFLRVQCDKTKQFGF